MGCLILGSAGLLSWIYLYLDKTKNGYPAILRKHFVTRVLCPFSTVKIIAFVVVHTIISTPLQQILSKAAIWLSNKQTTKLAFITFEGFVGRRIGNWIGLWTFL